MKYEVHGFESYEKRLAKDKARLAAIKNGSLIKKEEGEFSVEEKRKRNPRYGLFA
jgi:hypothetical protein